jgi:hypothetical protein
VTLTRETDPPYDRRSTTRAGRPAVGAFFPNWWSSLPPFATVVEHCFSTKKEEIYRATLPCNGEDRPVDGEDVAVYVVGADTELHALSRHLAPRTGVMDFSNSVRAHEFVELLFVLGEVFFPCVDPCLCRSRFCRT